MDVDDKQENNGEKRKQAPCRNPPHVKRRNLGENGYVKAIQRDKEREVVIFCKNTYPGPAKG